MIKRKLLFCSALGILVLSGLDTVVASAGTLDDTGVSEFFTNYRAMSSEQLNTASSTLTPITNIIGYLMGGLIAFTSSALFLITVLDLLYIAVPPVRGMLYKDGGNGKMSQFVSDEAVLCSTSMSGGSSHSMGSGYGMGGGYGMSGGMPQHNSEGSTKSMITAYFKKRLFFMILFAICTVILTSSILLGTGVNIAQWIMKLIEILNNSIPAI